MIEGLLHSTIFIDGSTACDSFLRIFDFTLPANPSSPSLPDLADLDTHTVTTWRLRNRAMTDKQLCQAVRVSLAPRDILSVSSHPRGRIFNPAMPAPG